MGFLPFQAGPHTKKNSVIFPKNLLLIENPICIANMVTTFQKKMSNLELWTTGKNISEPRILRSNQELRTIRKCSSSDPETNFKVLSRSSEKFSSSNPELKKITGFQPRTRKNARVSAWISEKISGLKPGTLGKIPGLKLGKIE